MCPVQLFPDGIVQDAGFGPEVKIDRARSTALLLTLSITRMMEQHTLSVAVWGSSDSRDWGGRPVVILPKRFYCGEYSHLLDLSSYPDIRFLRVEYSLNGWGPDDRPQISRFSVIAEPIYEMAVAAAG